MKGFNICALALAVATLPLAGLADAETQASQGPRVVSYDWGSVDTLEALGLESHVAGLPYQAAPAYMQHLLEDRIDVGGLKTPDAEAVSAAEPQLILVTGRQGEAAESLGEIAEVVDVSLAEGPYFDVFGDKVLGLAERFNAETEAEVALANLSEYIEQARASLPEALSVMVVTHNDGNFSLRQEPVVNELLQLTAPEVPEGVESVQRGARIFTPLTPEIMVRMSPDALLVVDRSSAIGGKPLDVSALQDTLADQGGESIKVVPLSADLWYLSGDGLGSIRTQVAEVVEAIGR
ncbi:MAG: ABC transporter substrate-binding protein [Halomonas sp.]|uniref:ABC transporter substrate-binding protein n=1 Tax=Halomonas sp. TaxID=1486246 RepID=UPI003F8DF4F6